MECTLLDSMKLQEKMKEELVRGHEAANQLLLVLGYADGESASLVTKIKSKFTTSLSFLSGNHDSKRKHIQASACCSTVSLPIVVESSSRNALKTVKTTMMFMDGRSSSKKRKTSHTWSRDAPDFTDDGHVWRKYGQKRILNTLYPRSYFRCSRKYDQGCKATKQVQKVEDESSLFRTTYFGNHTCKRSLLKTPELILGSPTEESNCKFMITFGNNNNFFPHDQEQYRLLSSYSSTEKEIIESNNHVESRACDYLVPCNQLMVFEPSENISSLPTMMELHSEYEDMMIYYNACSDGIPSRDGIL